MNSTSFNLFDPSECRKIKNQSTTRNRDEKKVNYKVLSINNNSIDLNSLEKSIEKEHKKEPKKFDVKQFYINRFGK